MSAYEETLKVARVKVILQGYNEYSEVNHPFYLYNLSDTKNAYEHCMLPIFDPIIAYDPCMPGFA